MGLVRLAGVQVRVSSFLGSSNHGQLFLALGIVGWVLDPAPLAFLVNLDLATLLPNLEQARDSLGIPE